SHIQKQFKRLQNQLKAQTQLLDDAYARIDSVEAQYKDELAQYNVLFEQSPAIKIVLNLNTGQIVDANQAACRFYGYDKATIIRMSIHQLNAIPDEEINQKIQDIANKHIRTFHSKHRLASGKIHDVEVFSAPIEVKGKTYLYSDIFDLSEHKERDAELRLLWHALNQSAISITITNKEGNIEYVNPYFTQVTGYTLAEVIGKKSNIFEVSYKSQDDLKNLWETITSGEPWSGEFHNQKKNGEPYWESVNISPIMDEDGNITHFMAIKENITERILVETKLAAYNTQLEELVSSRTSQLERLNERMNTVLNNVSTPVLLVDAYGRIDITNPAFNRKLGYQPDELFRHKLWSIFAETSQPQLIDLFTDTENTIAPFEAQLIAKDGTIIDAEVSLSHLSGNDNAVVCTLYDISHHKEVERVKDAFISMVSHELRTPITSIMLSVSTVNRFYERLTEAQRRRKLLQMSEQARTLSELVTSILDVARFSTRENKRSETIVDVAQVLHDVVSECIDQATADDKQIHVEVINEQTHMQGDQTDIMRIWNNLLSNAIKYTANGGEIVAKLYGGISMRQLAELGDFIHDLPSDIIEGQYIVGLVKDNGHGIRPEDAPQMFTRFFRGWATNTNILGTGLGLSYVRDLLHLYGGDITFRSTLGVGTTFCFWLLANENSIINTEELHHDQSSHR
ncbi:MAG: PAS domain S-box protein, partial [Anaerolineae bacterium]|nr:PAS domain S-box protein [Anaerolineae bacterium]